jgi:hypothetical protein
VRGAAEHLHYGWDEHRADDDCVEEDCACERDSEQLEDVTVAHGEGREDDDHDGIRRGDHAAGSDEALADGARMVVFV